MKFRKKPVVIEAWHFTDETKNRVLNDVRALNHSIHHDWEGANRDVPCIRIPTLEGEMTASLGDWIIQGVKGELYPCKPDIFEATYDPLPEINSPTPVSR
jgi:hypothetical protein